MLSRPFLLLVLLIVALAPPPASAQVATGTPPFGSFGGGPDVVNLANLNSHLTIPVIHKPGRGTNFTYDLSYDSSVWYPTSVNGAQTWQPVANLGWRGQTEIAVGYVSYHQHLYPCPVRGDGNYPVYDTYVYHDTFGIAHAYTGTAELDCNGLFYPFAETAADGSGYKINVTDVYTATITSPSGEIFSPPVTTTAGAATATDRNGNQITVNGSGQFFDTLSSTTPVVAITGSGTPTSPMTFTYTAPNGQPASYQMNYTQYTVNTYFHISGIVDYPRTSVALVSSIVLPDSSQYSFTYEPTPAGASCTPLSGTTSCVTGRIASITLPTGGSISYSYSGGNNGILPDGSTATLTRTVAPGGTWTYAQVKGTGAASTTTITDPQNNQTIVQFQGIYETQRDSYQASNLLQTIKTCYNGNTSNCPSTAITLPITRRNIFTLLPGGQQSEHDDFWSMYGVPTETDDYDYGAAPHGSLLKQTLITYASLGNITAFRQQVTVKNGSGTIVSQTNYNYDETTPTATSGVAQHVSVSGSRGNLTSINYPVSGLTAHFTYYDTGSQKTQQDVNAATTTYNYSSNVASCQMAFPTSISEPLSMSRSMTWNCTGGVAASVTDENNQPTTITWNDPYFWRPANENFPDGGQTAWTYNSQTSTTTITKMNTSQNIVGTVLLDGLGRTRQTQLNSDPQGVDYTDTTYDALGRVASVSNPYRSTSDPTYGLTSYQYDALSRVTKVIPPDGTSSTNNVSVSYSTNTTTVTDQAGKKRQSTLDALGRLTQVTEDPGGLGYVTTYSFDALSNLISVLQNGGRQRTFTYDALSRLVCESNPEIQIATCPNPDNGSYTAGTIRYGYDSGGNLTSRQAPAPNQTGSATVTTTYSWDVLHRLTAKTYTNGTPSLYYSYDVSPSWITGVTNPVGRLVDAYNQFQGTSGSSAAATVNSYDPMGRIVRQWQQTPSLAPGGDFLYYTYDLAGDMTSYTNGVSVTFTQSFDAAGRPTLLTSSLVDSTHPATLATVDSTLGYYPHGALRKMTPGNGLTQTAAFNKALQQCRMNVNSSATALGACGDAIPSGNLQDLNYGFNLGSSDNGNVMSWTATGQQAFNRTFTYDSLNRLGTLNQSSGSATGCSSTFNLSWTYDAWGNRTDQTVNSGTCNPFHATINTQNQLVGSPYQYDAAGNMTHDASHAYFYDAENRLVQVDGTFGTCSTATACYTYDAVGRRVEKATGSTYLDYLYDLAGNVLTEWCTNCGGYTGPTSEYIFLSGNFVAEYKNNTTYFIHPDLLGSARLLTALNQSVAQNLDYLPFGELNSSNSGVTTHEFTGDERDSETGLDHTWFRNYSSSLGRWMHPDPAGLAAVDPTNPQSWNRYSYVLNSPLNYTDPSGLTDCPQGKTCFVLDGEVIDPSSFFGRMLFAALGLIDEFDILELAFTPTGRIPNPDFWNGSCWLGDCPNMPAFLPVYGNIDLLSLLFGLPGRGNTSGRAPQIGPQPTLKFKPPSWQNFTHEFLPCYGAQLLDNFVGNKGKAGVTAGTVALTVKNPWVGGPLLVAWTGINAFKAGAACAVASRAVYE